MKLIKENTVVNYTLTCFNCGKTHHISHLNTIKELKDWMILSTEKRKTIDNITSVACPDCSNLLKQNLPSDFIEL